ncbi:MAG: thymidylate synthase [Sulfuricurvum sp. PC08-66]|nr:MAG: thymidylate synthase [Sulfuricurvum sp. PC08-66]
MTVTFLPSASAPSDIAVSAARTCYFPNGIVKPEASTAWPRKEALLESIFKAGHHTTLQHAHVTMLIEGMSRHLIWRLLHAHTYYNSEQISQRYAKMKQENFYYPPQGKRDEWEAFYAQSYADYEALLEMLTPAITPHLPKFRHGQEAKVAQEMARYVLPVGMSAYLYHTANIVTLLRYIAVAPTMPEARAEAMEFAALLETNLLALDPALAPLIEHAKASRPTFPTIDIIALKNRIDAQSDVTVYDVVGEIDASTIGINYADVLRASQMSHDTNILGGFSTAIRLSFSADAQNQRHRKSPAIRPAIEPTYVRDAYTPPLIAQHPQAYALYRASIERSYEFFDAQRARMGFGEAIYALSNAHRIDIVERNDFAAFAHKAQMRLCYNAQQEIYDIVYEQVTQLRAMGVAGSQYLLPPCSVRAAQGIHPICPEGTRYCGVKVWKLDFAHYRRTF